MTPTQILCKQACCAKKSPQSEENQKEDKSDKKTNPQISNLNSEFN